MTVAAQDLFVGEQFPRGFRFSGLIHRAAENHIVFKLPAYFIIIDRQKGVEQGSSYVFGGDSRWEKYAEYCIRRTFSSKTYTEKVMLPDTIEIIMAFMFS